MHKFRGRLIFVSAIFVVLISTTKTTKFNRHEIYPLYIRYIIMITYEGGSKRKLYLACQLSQHFIEGIALFKVNKCLKNCESPSKRALSRVWEGDSTASAIEDHVVMIKERWLPHLSSCQRGGWPPHGDHTRSQRRGGHCIYTTHIVHSTRNVFSLWGVPRTIDSRWNGVLFNAASAIYVYCEPGFIHREWLSTLIVLQNTLNEQAFFVCSMHNSSYFC